MRAIDVMTTRFVAVGPDAAVAEAVRLMLGHRIGALPVVDGDGRPVGIVTEGDLLRRIEAPQRPRWRELFSPQSRLAAVYATAQGRRVADLMSRNLVAVDELTSLADIAELFEARRIKRVPVVRGGRLVGIVSRADLLQALASGGRPVDTDADQILRERLLGELRRQRWTHLADANIVVCDGIVHLWGAVGSIEERAALRLAAERVGGVRGVEDHTAMVHYLG